jgi:hypothetical protein
MQKGNLLRTEPCYEVKKAEYKNIGHTEASKHTCMVVWPAGWSRLAPAAKGGAWPGAGESPIAPTATSSVAASAADLLMTTSLSTASITVALLSMASLSTVAFTAAATSAVAGVELLNSPTANDNRNHFCSGASSSDDTSSSSRTTHSYFSLPLLRAGAGPEPPTGPPPPAGPPPRPPTGPPPTVPPPRPRSPTTPPRPPVPGIATPQDMLPLCTVAISTSSSVGIVANNVVLITWFTQMGLQAASDTMSLIKTGPWLAPSGSRPASPRLGATQAHGLAA